MYYYNNLQKKQKAVALGFDEKVDNAPKVLASGSGLVAEQIVQVARDNNIPLHQDIDLVEILSVLEINDHIPLEVYSVVAEVFSYIYEQEVKKKKNT
ncbi:MAG: EscU/YscU/HrcU family type III secretion system export apparatus switch protein [Rickettsiaceae bacterium]